VGYKESVLGKLDAGYAHEVTKTLVEIGPHKVAGTEKEHKAAAWIHDEMKKVGVADVTSEGFPVYVRDVSQGALLTVLEPEKKEILAYPMPCTYPTEGDGITGELVYVNRGTAADFLHDMNGKVVLAKIDWPDMKIGSNQNYFRSRMAVESWVRGASAVVVFDDLAPPGAVRSLLHPLSPIPVIGITNSEARTLTSSLKQGTKLVVNVKSHIQKAMPGISYNIIGTIRGSRYPDERIIIASHYDTWWNGAADSLSGVGCLLDIARAMNDAGVSPDRSIVFIAHGAEEQGWPCWFDWLIGSYSNIFLNHPDWAGKVVAELNVDVVGFKLGDCSIETTPELYPVVKKAAEDIEMRPGSLFYSTSPSRLFTILDSGTYLFAGVPTANITFWPEHYWTYYHTACDDMQLVTDESLLWTSRLWATTSLRLASSGPMALSLCELAKAVETDAQDNRQRLASSGVVDVDFSTLLSHAQDLNRIGRELEVLAGERRFSGKDVSLLGGVILKALRHFNRNMYILGGSDADSAYYATDPYTIEASSIVRAVRSLRRRDVGDSIARLEEVFAMRSGKSMSQGGYRYVLDNCITPRIWAQRLQRYVDVYPEWESLRSKMQSGEQFEEEIRSLEMKLDFVFSDLKDTVASTDRIILRVNDMVTEGMRCLEIA